MWVHKTIVSAVKNLCVSTYVITLKNKIYVNLSVIKWVSVSF